MSRNLFIDSTEVDTTAVLKFNVENALNHNCTKLDFLSLSGECLFLSNLFDIEVIGRVKSCEVNKNFKI